VIVDKLNLQFTGTTPTTTCHNNHAMWYNISYNDAVDTGTHSCYYGVLKTSTKTLNPQLNTVVHNIVYCYWDDKRRQNVTIKLLYTRIICIIIWWKAK